MQRYNFISVWKLKAHLQDVWDAINEPEQWPLWWKGLAQVKCLKKLNTKGTGDIYFLKWKYKISYALKFTMEITEIDELKTINGKVTGDVEGTSRWEFTFENEITTVKHFWNITTTKKWMNFIAPVAKPFFTASHNILMKNGAKGLCEFLNARLIKS